MGKNKLKIGEFSRLGRVTVRALRHYEEIDLLTPEIVDRDTGYRYYSVGQLQKVFSITKLKSMGYSLEEIRALAEMAARAYLCITKKMIQKDAV